jgi:hypothetical protein
MTDCARSEACTEKSLELTPFLASVMDAISPAKPAPMILTFPS